MLLDKKSWCMYCEGSLTRTVAGLKRDKALPITKPKGYDLLPPNEKRRLKRVAELAIRGEVYETCDQCHATKITQLSSGAIEYIRQSA